MRMPLLYRTFIVFSLIFCALLVNGQYYFLEAESVWDDRLEEWDILCSNEQDEFILNLVSIWPFDRSNEEWRFKSDLINGTIKTKWRGDFSTWELRAGEVIVVFSQRIKNDANHWLIQSDQNILRLQRVKYRVAEWVGGNSQQSWQMGFQDPQDNRSWWIEDFLVEEYNLETRLALIFIAIWSSL